MATERGEGTRPPAIVFTDVDGTLLNAEHCLTARTIEAGRALADREIPLVLVSARMPAALAAIRSGMCSSGPTICYGGAYVTDGAGNELLSRSIAIGCALEVRDFVICDVPDVTWMAYGYHSWVVPDRTDPRVLEEERIVGVQSVEGRLEDHFADMGIHKFLLSGRPDSIARAEREVSSAFSALSVTRSSSTLCEIMSGGVSKSEGIEVVCDSLSVPVTSAVALGDGRNDIDMLRMVPESWAMRNAPDAVKRAAAHVTAHDNDHEGFAETVFSLLSRGRA